MTIRHRLLTVDGEARSERLQLLGRGARCEQDLRDVDLTQELEDDLTRGRASLVHEPFDDGSFIPPTRATEDRREVRAMSLSDAPFEVLGHIDYPLRTWPASAGAVPWAVLEDDFRAALETTAASGRALEVNTRLPLAAALLDWWYQAGGTSVVSGSDAHRPDDLARDFTETAAMVAAHGYRPGPTPYEHWRRS